MQRLPKRLVAFAVLAATMAIPAFAAEPAGLLQKFLDTSKAYHALPVVKRTPAVPPGACRESQTVVLHLRR